MFRQFTRFTYFLDTKKHCEWLTVLLILPAPVVGLIKLRLKYAQETCLKYFELKNSSGEVVELDDETRDLIDNEMELFETEYHNPNDIGFTMKRKYYFSYSNDMTPRIFSSAVSRKGCNIFFPQYLSYKTEEDFVSKPILLWPTWLQVTRLWRNPVEVKIDDWTTAHAQQLKDAMLLSLEAKRYLIRRYLQRSVSLWLSTDLFATIGGPTVSAVAYFAYDVLVKGGFVTNLLRLPVFAGLFACSYYSSYAALRYMPAYLERTIDAEVFNLDKRKTHCRDAQHLKGAREFWQKQLDRQVALRNLAPTVCQEIFDEHGERKDDSIRVGEYLKYLKTLKEASPAEIENSKPKLKKIELKPFSLFDKLKSR